MRGSAAQELPSREEAPQIVAVSEAARWPGSSWQRGWLRAGVWQALLPPAEVLGTVSPLRFKAPGQRVVTHLVNPLLWAQGLCLVVGSPSASLLFQHQTAVVILQSGGLGGETASQLSSVFLGRC